MNDYSAGCLYGGTTHPNHCTDAAGGLDVCWLYHCKETCAVDCSPDTPPLVPPPPFMPPPALPPQVCLVDATEVSSTDGSGVTMRLATRLPCAYPCSFHCTPRPQDFT